ncbi:protease FtsH-inhibitory lysogeny factor CIII [Pantoea septica]|nr:protease FtsH-inhibitory lysogeny factor CIII [Pantoea septica]
MNYAIAGGAVVGSAQFDESLLDVITRRLRTGWRSLVDTLNQRGNPQ